MSYRYRKDNRTDKEFAADIKRAHQKEAIFAEAYRLQLEHVCGTEVEYEPYGCGPDGEVIKGKLNDDGDALYRIGDYERVVEIKTCPEWLDSFFTFKVSSLKKCVNNESRLLVVKRGCFWVCDDPEMIEEMLFLEHKIYYKFSPNDLAVRLNRELIEHYFGESTEWCDTAQKHIDDNKELLL